MGLDYTPFTPGRPVPVELFVGREDELKRLFEHVKAATHGRNRPIFISGERGIGKSSLAAYVKRYAEREQNLAGAHVFLGGAGTVKEMVRRIFEAILHESDEKNWYGSIKDLLGQTVKSADLFGLKMTFSPSEEQLEQLSRNFTRALRQTITRLRDQKKAVGFTLVLDDINGLAESREFADWLKSTIDDIAVNHEMPLCLILVGIEERRRSLIALNESVARLFDLVSIKPWSMQETRQFYREAFDQVGVKVDPDAMDFIVRYAGGLPPIAHEIGDATLRVASSKTIDRADAMLGIAKAARVVGEKLVQEQVINAIRSKKYRAILQKLTSESSDSFFNLKLDRASLISIANNDEVKIVDNFLRRMKKLGAFELDHDEGPGHYKITSYILAMYLYMEFGRPSPKSS